MELREKVFSWTQLSTPEHEGRECKSQSQSQSLTLHVGLIAVRHDVVRELVGLQRFRVPPRTIEIFSLDKLFQTG